MIDKTKTKLETAVLDADKLEKDLRGKSIADLQARRKELKAKVGDLNDKIKSAECDLTKVDGLKGETTADRYRAIQEIADELKGCNYVIEDRMKAQRLIKELDDGYADDDEYVDPESGETVKRGPVAFGDRVFESDEFQESFAKGGRVEASMRLEGVSESLLRMRAATMTTTAGYPAPTIRRAGPVLLEGKPVEMLDVVQMVQEPTGKYTWVKETTHTSGAKPKAEAAALDESTFVLAEESVSLESVGTILPVTNRQLRSEPAVRTYLNEVLPLAVRRVVSNQILNGDGTSPNLKGILGTTGVGNVAKKAADDLFDVYLDGIAKVENDTGEMVNFVMVSPNEYVRLAKSKTTDKQFIYGAPGLPMNASLFGVPILKSNYLPANTAMVGFIDASSIQLPVAGDVLVETGLNGTDFAKNMQTIRAVIDINVALLRPACFVRLTALNV